MLKSATTTVADIEFLKGREEFNRFMDRIKAQADGLADEVLHSDMPPEVREAKRRFRLGLLEVLRAPAELLSSNVALLRQYG